MVCTPCCSLPADGCHPVPDAATRRRWWHAAQELRADGLSLAATAERLRAESEEAAEITKNTLASLLRRQSEHRAVDDLPAGLDRRTVNYVHTILHRALQRRCAVGASRP